MGIIRDRRLVLNDFGIFWRQETDPDAKRQLLGLLFEKIWLDERRVVGVQPQAAFGPSSNSRAENRWKRDV